MSVGNSSSTDVPEVMDQTWLRAVFIVLYCIIFILGVGGNILVIIVVLRNKVMQTITNLFITNLAASDILICIFAVPFTPLGALMESWIFGEALCHLVPMIMAVNVFVSTLTSIAIAGDRYLIIVHPFKPRIKVRHCLFIILVIWFIAICTSLPMSVFMEHFHDNVTDTYQCREQWPGDGESGKYYGAMLMLLQYVLPCIIIMFCYIAVGLVLRKRATMKIGSKSQQREQVEIRRKRKTNRMLILMIAIFVCCWMPLNTFHLVTSFIPTKSLEKFHLYLLCFFTVHVIAMSSTIYNPFLYAFMNDNFRKEFHLFIPCCFRMCKKRDVNGSLPMPYTQASELRRASTPNADQGSDSPLNGKSNVFTQNVAFESDSCKVHLFAEQGAS